MNKKDILLKYLNCGPADYREEMAVDLILKNEPETRDFLEIFWHSIPGRKFMPPDAGNAVRSRILKQIEGMETSHQQLPVYVAEGKGRKKLRLSLHTKSNIKLKN